MEPWQLQELSPDSLVAGRSQKDRSLIKGPYCDLSVRVFVGVPKQKQLW